MIDFDDLAEKERAATPAPWTWDPEYHGDIEHRGAGVLRIQHHGCVHTVLRHNQTYSHNDAAFLIAIRNNARELIEAARSATQGAAPDEWTVGNAIQIGLMAFETKTLFSARGAVPMLEQNCIHLQRRVMHLTNALQEANAARDALLNSTLRAQSMIGKACMIVNDSWNDEEIELITGAFNELDAARENELKVAVEAIPKENPK